MKSIIANNNQMIKSTELVEIINQFREIEGAKAELKHKTFMEKIRKEVETLKKLQLNGEQNFLPSSYANLQNKEQPCFLLNRDGMLQMLNSESTLVRYKTISYINELESKNSIEQKYLTMSDEDRAIAYFTKLKENRLLREEATKLEDKVKEDAPLVQLAMKRLDKSECVSITDATKTFELKRGKITKWAKDKGYLHKTLTEVNKNGTEYFKVYEAGAYKCVGIKEEGLKLINNSLEEIKAS